MKTFSIGIILFAVLSTTFACSQYSLEVPEERNSNEAAARALYEPLQQYFSENNTYPEQLSELVPNYVDELPETVSGNEFQYGTIRSDERRIGFRIYWYQKNTSDSKVMACSVSPPAQGSDVTYESNDCWNPDASEWGN